MKVIFRCILCACLFVGFGSEASSRVMDVFPAKSTAMLSSIIQKAGEGDTIQFKPGHYHINSLYVGKRLSLLGSPGTILDGDNRNQVIIVGASGCLVRGFKIINVGVSDLQEYSGIRIENASNVRIEDNVLEHVFFGIYCSNAVSCIISNNRIHSGALSELQSGNGIHCWKCDSMTITSNDIQGQRDGIYFEFVTNSTIRQNNSHDNVRYGLHFMFSHQNSYTGNVFTVNGAGVAVMYSHQVTMKGNTFSRNLGESSYGILMKDISDSHVEGNNFTANTIGIYMEGTSRILVRNNTFSSNGWAFRIQASCSAIQVEHNAFLRNTFDVATNGSLVLNKFEYNFWDKYEGYDTNRDGIGDIPYRPVSLYSVIAERMPYSIMLFRSFMVMLLERTEKAIPGLTPVDLKDDKPLMKHLS